MSMGVLKWLCTACIVMIRWYKKATYIEHWMANTECLLLAANAYLIHRLLQKMRLGNKNYDYKRFPTVWSILAEFWSWGESRATWINDTLAQWHFVVTFHQLAPTQNHQFHVKKIAPIFQFYGFWNKLNPVALRIAHSPHNPTALGSNPSIPNNILKFAASKCHQKFPWGNDYKSLLTLLVYL